MSYVTWRRPKFLCVPEVVQGIYLLYGIWSGGDTVVNETDPVAKIWGDSPGQGMDRHYKHISEVVRAGGQGGAGSVAGLQPDMLKENSPQSAPGPITATELMGWSHEALAAFLVTCRRRVAWQGYSRAKFFAMVFFIR